MRLARVECWTANTVFSKKLTCFNSEHTRIWVELVPQNLIPSLKKPNKTNLKPKSCFKQENWLYNLCRFSEAYARGLCIPQLVAAWCQATLYQPIKLLSRAVSLKLHGPYGHWLMLLINYFSTTLLSINQSINQSINSVLKEKQIPTPFSIQLR